MDGEVAGIAFTDPPYNVPIDGHVCGLGRVRHREFAMGAGEMSPAQFTEFLRTALSNMMQHLRHGAILYVCMDWRHMRELCEAGEDCGLELKNLVVWNKTNGGMGAFYRSKHELIFVFKCGDAPHINSFGLGDTGRYRTNVWDYAGISSISASRDSELAMHPTVTLGRFLQTDPIGYKDQVNLYAYTGNDPINAIDGSGQRTTILTVYDGVTNHTAIFVSRDGQNVLYDPGGSYAESHGSGSGQVLEGADIRDFIDYHRDGGADVRLQTFNSSRETDSAIIANAMDQGGASPGFCTTSVCSVVGATGLFDKVPDSNGSWRPGQLATAIGQSNADLIQDRTETSDGRVVDNLAEQAAQTRRDNAHREFCQQHPGAGC